MISKEYNRLNIISGDLRISITNACNMQCSYCHNEGQDIETLQFMSIDDLKYIVNQSMKYGIFKVRITGGEPLVHPRLEDLLSMLRMEFSNVEIGINTNGMLGDKLINICKKHLVDRVVIGLDYYDAPISKQSLVGTSSKQIRESILKIKGIGIKADVAIVFDKNKNDIFKLITWAISNGIEIKIIEKTVPSRENTDDSFYRLIDEIEEKFYLSRGIAINLNEFYLTNGKIKIKFFQSHCNRDECAICGKLHMRITCNGEANPCIMRNDMRFSLLDGDFDFNMCRAIANLGNGPNNPIL